MTDADGDTDTVTFTITITEPLSVNQPPAVTGPSTRTYVENGTATVATYTAADPEHDPLTWSLSGDDSGAFSISATGTLTFTTPPDYEAPTDADADNVYRVTVQVSDGTTTATLAVVVTVTDVTGICARTPQVREGILARLPTISDCERVTASDLSGLTGGLVLSNAGITTLQAQDFSGLTSLQSILLSENALSSLPANVFKGLTQLHTLHMSGNVLSTLPAGVFKGLTNLRSLHLFDNTLSALPPHVFKGLTNLRSLRLDGNTLRTLPAGVFTDLANLQSLVLYGNALTSLPAGVFKGLAQLQYLALFRNELTSLPADVFAGLTQLHTLGLFDNALSDLPADLFAGLTELRELHLQENSLRELPAAVFTGLAQLHELYLHENALEELPAGLFAGLAQLRELYLRDNPGAPFTLTPVVERQGDEAVVVKVAEGTPFDLDVRLSAEGGTLSSTALTIQGGQTASDTITVTPAASEAAVVISVEAAEFDEEDYRDYDDGIRIGAGGSLSLPFGTPLAMSGLAAVDYAEHSAVPVAAYTVPDSQSSALTWSLSGDDSGAFSISATGTLTFTTPPDYETPTDADTDNVYRVTVQVSDGTNAATLAVVVTVTDGTGICTRTPQVREGILARLPTISDCERVTASDLSGLTGGLVLSNAGITTLQAQDFSGLTSLQSILLSENALSSFPANVFKGLTQLHTLHMSGNALSALPPHVFKGLANLRSLHLFDNTLSALPPHVFKGLTQLQTLRLDGNALRTLPAGVFTDLAKLQTLVLYGNALTSLPPHVFTGLTQLQYLALFRNELTSLPAGVFAGLTNLQTLALFDNALRALPADLFAGLTQLRDLHLQENSLRELPADRVRRPHPAARSVFARERSGGTPRRSLHGPRQAARAVLARQSWRALHADGGAGTAGRRRRCGQSSRGCALRPDRHPVSPGRDAVRQLPHSAGRQPVLGTGDGQPEWHRADAGDHHAVGAGLPRGQHAPRSHADRGTASVHDRDAGHAALPGVFVLVRVHRRADRRGG